VTYPGLLKVLDTDSPEDVERWCRESVPEAAATLNALLPRAVSGNRIAAFGYIRLWRSLTDSFLATLRAEQPDLVFESEGRLFVVDIKNSATPVSRLVLEAEALEAPFSSWVLRTHDVGVGACAALVQKLRDTIPRFRPVDLEVHGLPHWDVSESQLRAFRKNVSAALSEGDPPLERIREVFDLSMTELGDLFGVTRQAVAQWLESGVPGDRLAKVATVASIAELLDSHLRPGSVPGIVRRPADAYSGRSALQMVKQDRHDELLRSVRESFAWARPA
jgi:hypothetical protein